VTNKQILNIKHTDSKIIIRFPLKPLTIFSHVFFCFLLFCFGIYSKNASVWVIIFSFTCFSFFVSNMIMLYLRKLVIDRDQKTVSYFSYFYRTFEFSDIIFLESKVDIGMDEPDRYFLLFKLKNKVIRVETQSEEQSETLRGEIVALINNGRLTFRR